MAPESLGYQEDQGCTRRQTADRYPYRHQLSFRAGHKSCPDLPASIHWYHWMSLESTDAVSTPAPLPVAAPSPAPAPSVESLYSALATHLRETRPNEDLAPLERAYRFASERHKGQKRVSGEPYMTHPLLVSGLLADMHMDMVCLQTGLLHDVVEDTSRSEEH